MELATFTAAPLVARVQYAETLATAGDLIPRGLRDNRGNPVPGKILLVAETGSMLGMHPIAALQGVNIIDGKPTISPALMSAVVRRAGHKLRVTTRGSVKDRTFEATATLIRADDPDAPFSATWNLERATRAGLAGKGAWAKYFEAMCKARAISEVCREGAEDALMGVGYVPEELGADVDEQGNVVEGVAPVQPATWAPAQEAEPRPTEEVVDAEVVENAVDPSAEWVARGQGAASLVELEQVFRAAGRAQALALVTPSGEPLIDALRAMKARFEQAAPAPEPERPTDWVGRARAAASRSELGDLVKAAAEAGVSREVLDEMAGYEESLPGGGGVVEPGEGAMAFEEDDRG